MESLKALRAHVVSENSSKTIQNITAIKDSEQIDEVRTKKPPVAETSDFEEVAPNWVEGTSINILKFSEKGSP